ncbi:MAG: LuxR family transcriptional regulator [Rhizobium sp.]|nr:LuxR family transcriptional regulator [Rhizobium sp.]
MPISALSAITVKDFPDLRSVPKLRRLADSSIVDNLARAVPFDFIAVSGLDVDDFRFGETVSSDTTFPPAFIEAYIAEGLGKTDPFVLEARNATATVVEADVYRRAQPPQRLVYLAQTFGIHNRTLFPVRRGDVTYGAITVTRDTPFRPDEITFMEVVAEAIHTHVTQPIRERFAAGQMKLTAGELACLAQASYGLTSEAIGKATGYQTETVNSYIKSATKKLSVSNRTHAIAEAIRRKLIS